MRNSSIHSDLSRQIEQLVQTHLAAVRSEAEAAVARAFASAGPRRIVRAKGPGAKVGGRRRSRDEINALCDRLLELVVETPGASMTALAPKLGLSPRELQRPMSLLKRSGRVRSVGQRHLTRYFPLASKTRTTNG